MLTDIDLLAFRMDALSGDPHGDARRLLDVHGETFRAQLVAARWLEGYLERRKVGKDETAWPRRSNDERDAGFEEAIRDVVTHLRQGDFLPGGRFYEDEQTYG